MKLRSKLALVSAFMAALFSPALMPVANAENVQGQATIVSAATCGLAFVSGSPISYGSLSSGQVSLEQTLVIDNTGNAQGALSVSGTNWLSGATTIMNAGATHYSTTPGVAYGSKTALLLDGVAGSPASIGVINPTTNLGTYWQLRADLVAGQTGFAGSTTQTVTFTSAC